MLVCVCVLLEMLFVTISVEGTGDSHVLFAYSRCALSRQGGPIHEVVAEVLGPELIYLLSSICPVVPHRQQLLSDLK